jgi:hypothetical protein
MINTKFAQTFVSSKTLRFGIMSLLFTFVFLGTGVTAQAQSVVKTPSKVDYTVLDGYTFKLDRAEVRQTLDELRREASQAASSSNTELYDDLYYRLVYDFILKLDANPNQDVRSAFFETYDNLHGYASKYRNPNATISLVGVAVAEELH